jgi:hypothetical protein
LVAIGQEEGNFTSMNKVAIHLYLSLRWRDFPENSYLKIYTHGSVNNEGLYTWRTKYLSDCLRLYGSAISFRGYDWGDFVPPKTPGGAGANMKLRIRQVTR